MDEKLRKAIEDLKEAARRFGLCTLHARKDCDKCIPKKKESK